MKKCIAGILIAALATFSLCASGQNGDAEKSGKGEKIQLKLGIWPEESQTAEVESNMKLKAEFEKLYPNIEVIPAFYKYAPDTFMPMAASGELPTVYETWFTEPQKIIDNGFARDITAEVKKYGYDKEMNPSVEKLLSRDGKIYGLPRDGYALGLYVNMDLFRQAGLVDSKGYPLYPKTYDDLIKVAQTIKQKTGKAGMYIASKDNVGGWHFTNLAWDFGASFSKKVNGKVTANIDSPEVLAAFKYVYDLKWKYDVLLDNTLLGWNEWIQNFGTDQVAMCFAASDVVQLPVNDYGMSKDAIAIEPIPAGPGGQYSLMGGTPYMFAPNATDAEVDAALKWLKFIGRLGTIDDAGLASRRTDLETKAAAGEPVGPQALQVWMNPDTNKKINALYSELENVDMGLFDNYYKVSQYNLRPEEPYNAQDLYKLLDGILQAILSDRNTNIPALLKEANSTYQTNYLDLLQ